MRAMRHLVSLTSMLLLVACSAQDPSTSPDGGLMSPGPVGVPRDPGAILRDAGTALPDAGGQACVPGPCAGDVCGQQPDGCGGTMWCTPCPAEVLVEGLGEVRDFEVGPDGVFWLELDRDADLSTLRRIPLTGGTPEVLATGDGFEELALGQGDVYITDWGAKTVVRVPLAGGPAVTVATQQGLPDEITVDGTHVYWAGFVGTVSRAPLAGGSPTLLTPSSFPHSPRGLAVDVNSLFVGTFDGSIWRATLDGRDWGTIRQPASGDGLTEMVMDGTHLYWADANAGRILRIAKEGGPVQLLVEGAQAGDLEVDDRFLYWTASTSIRRMPKEGGPITDVAVQLWYPSELELEGAYLYWLDEGSGANRAHAVRRIAR